MAYEFEYMQLVVDLFQKAHDNNKEVIKDLAVKFADNIKNSVVGFPYV